MNIDIQTTQDDNFKINSVKFGSLDDRDVSITPYDNTSTNDTTVIPDQIVYQEYKTPKPVSLENHKSTGVSWFEGTSWSTKQ